MTSTHRVKNINKQEKLKKDFTYQSIRKQNWHSPVYSGRLDYIA